MKPMKPQRGSLKQQARTVAEKIRDRIIRGELPTGSVISEQELSQTYRCTRHVVRLVLETLVSWHLATVERNGTTVRGFSIDDVQPCWRFRRAIEPMIAETLIQLAKPVGREVADTLEAMQKVVAQGGPAGLTPGQRVDFLRLDRTFHLGLLHSLGGLFDFLEPSYDMALTRLHKLWYGAIGKKETIEEHAAILKAIRARSVDDARAAASAHLERALERWTENILARARGDLLPG